MIDKELKPEKISPYPMMSLTYTPVERYMNNVPTPGKTYYYKKIICELRFKNPKGLTQSPEYIFTYAMKNIAATGLSYNFIVVAGKDTTKIIFQIREWKGITTLVAEANKLGKKVRAKIAELKELKKKG